MAPPECTAQRSGTASVLPPAPTVLSSHVRINREPACLSLYVFFSVLSCCVCINCEPACRDVGGEKSDGDVSDEDRDEGEDEDGDEDKDEREHEDEDEHEHGDEHRDEHEHEHGDVEKDAPILHFGPLKCHSVSGLVKSVDGNIFIFVTVNLFLFLFLF